MVHRLRLRRNQCIRRLIPKYCSTNAQTDWNRIPLYTRIIGKGLQGKRRISLDEAVVQTMGVHQWSQEAVGMPHPTFPKIAYSLCRKLLTILSLVLKVPAIQATARPLVTLRAPTIAITIATPTGTTKLQSCSTAPIRQVLTGGPTITLARTTRGHTLFVTTIAHRETFRRS